MEAQQPENTPPILKFKPIEQMRLSVESAKLDSDTAMFYQLMYQAEQLVKLVVCGILANVEEDSKRHRYSQEYKIVRASGIGEWAAVLDDIITGPTAQFLHSGASGFRKELTEAKKIGDWQYDATNLISGCLQIVDINAESINQKVQLRSWFTLFARFRNKTRGHGAFKAETCSKLCLDLQKSIHLIEDNFSLFRISWVYLKQNLNGKYRVTQFSGDIGPFNHLRSSDKENLQDGVYLYAEGIRRISVIFSDPELADVYFPNGGFAKNTFECLSYISGDKIHLTVTPYLVPPGDLPQSHTEGRGELEPRGKSLTNSPTNPTYYIDRPELEEELVNLLQDDRHPVITLVGTGGIGKTSLAISVLEKFVQSGEFTTIIWFSARDIDLLIEGAKPVKPKVLSIPDVINEYHFLIGSTAKLKAVEKKSQIERDLAKSSLGPMLFVFDNFETVINPKEVYSWLNTYIRLPNKILITTRFRDFKGDYPIVVHGMNRPEFDKLVESVAKDLKIPSESIGESYLDELFLQSEGHPYVTKILLGERLQNPSENLRAILVGKDDILTALFERTYSNLSPLAKRIFLTASNWRSTIPEIAIQSVLIRSNVDPKSVEEAIDELAKSSLIEHLESDKDSTHFMSVPLSASFFGKKKLSVDILKTAIETDTRFLHYFGAGDTDVSKGIAPRINRFFSELAKHITKRTYKLQDITHIVQFLCEMYPDAWVTLSELYEENGKLNDAIKAVLKYLEATKDEAAKKSEWQRLNNLYRKAKNWQGQVHSLVELSLNPHVSLYELSNAANLVNMLFHENKIQVDALEKKVAIEKVIDVFERRIMEEGGEATDYSRLAWLYMNLTQQDKAQEMVNKGLGLDPDDIHCLKLVDRLSQQY